MAKETAEQKLLRLIEAGSDAPLAENATPPSSGEAQEVFKAVSNVGGSIAMPPALANMLGLFRNFFGKVQSGEAFGIRQVNIILVVVVMCGLAFFVLNILSGIRAANRPVHFSSTGRVDFVSDQLLPIVPELQRYISAVSFRNIFHPFEKKEPELVEQNQEIPEVPQKLADKTQNLKLVGISWQDTPESASAMMENTETGITYFLRNGERVNGVNVKTIYANSVVLELDGNEMEMKL